MTVWKPLPGLCWAVAGGLLAAPIVAYFADRQFAAACCENGSDYAGALGVTAVVTSILILILSPFMFGATAMTRAARIPRLGEGAIHAALGTLLGAAIGWVGFAQFPPWLEEVDYPGMAGLLPGGLTGFLAGAGWSRGIGRNPDLFEETADG